MRVNVVRARVAEEFGVEYFRRDPCKPVLRLGFVFAEPKHIPRAADEQSQRGFIRLRDRTANGLPPTESVAFADAVLGFFDETLPARKESMIDTITDNCRVISCDRRLVVG